MNWPGVVMLGLATAITGLIGGLQLSRALPKKTIVAPGTTLQYVHHSGARKYSGEEWDVYIDVPGHGVRTADSHGLYKVVEASGGVEGLHVMVHIRGSLTTQVDYKGHAYRTAAVSRTEAWIEAVVFLVLCALCGGALATYTWLRYSRHPAATGA